MADNTRDSISRKLQTLARHPDTNFDVQLVVSPQGRRLSFTHRRKHIPTILFVWSRDHFIGYLVDDEGNTGLALLSIWSVPEAHKFTRWYLTTLSLSARRRGVVVE